MEHKKATLLRTFEQIRELFEDVNKLETAVETISTDSDFEKVSLTGNVIINSLVTKLNDVDDRLKSKYTGQLKRKRQKLLKRNQRKLEKEKQAILENVGDGSSDDCKPLKKVRNKRVNNSVENENPNSKQTEIHDDVSEDDEALLTRHENNKANRTTASKMTDSEQEDLRIKRRIKQRKTKKVEKLACEEDSELSQDENKNIATKRRNKTDEDSNNLHDEEEKNSRESAEEIISERRNKETTVDVSGKDVDEEKETSTSDHEKSTKKTINAESSFEENDDKANSEGIEKEDCQDEDNLTQDVCEDIEVGELHVSFDMEAENDDAEEENDSFDKKISKASRKSQRNKGSNQRTVDAFTNDSEDAETATTIRINEEFSEENANTITGVEKDNLESELDKTKSGELHPTDVSLGMPAAILLADSDDKNKNNESVEVPGNLSEGVDPEAAHVEKKCSDKEADFPISFEKLESIVSTFLNNRPSSIEKEKKKQVFEKRVEHDISVVEVDDDDDDKSDDLVGKIKLVDIGKLTQNEMPKIKVADFAKVQVSPLAKEGTGPRKQISKHEKRRRNKKDSDGTLIRNPFAKRLSEELEKLKQKRENETNRNKFHKIRERPQSSEEDEDNKTRIRNPFAKGLRKELDKLKEQRTKRLEKQELEHDPHNANKLPNIKEGNDKSIQRNKEKKSPADLMKQFSPKVKHSRKKPKFVIPNNVPITLVTKSITDEASGATDKVFYCVAKPEELLDTKLLLRCYVNMSVKRSPEELLREYNERKEDVQDLEVRLDDSDDDGDDGDESDSSSTMVLTASKRTLRSNASSNVSSRASSVNSKRSTRNSKPVLDSVVKSSSDDDGGEAGNDVSSDDEVLVKKRNGNKMAEKTGGERGGRPPRKERKEKNGGKDKRRGKDESSDNDDAMSHVSISSTSEAEIKKSSIKKLTLKMSKNSKSARSSRKKSGESEEASDSDDSVPLTQLPDRKIKKELDNSDTLEPAKKKDKKTNKKKGSESDIEESDNDDSTSDKKKKMNKRGAKKKIKRVVSDSGSDYDKEASEDDEIESVKSSASEEKAIVNKPTRKRIKRVNDDSSDDSDGVKVKRGRKKKGEQIDTRKHIRNILSKGALNQSTIDAEQEESDRKRRILEKQKRYNDIYNAKDLESDKMDKVVLDIDDDTNEEILSVDRSIVKHLKPHQAKGIQFMWNACFESVSIIDQRGQKGSGCILAHCMGLGKTLQVIALIHTLITNSDTTKSEKALVVCPLSTVLNWVSEFKKWLRNDLEFEIYELVSCKQVTERQHKIADWHKHGGVMIMGYDMFRNLSNPDNKRITKKARNTFVTGLVDPGPDLVICDEGHLLKNEKTSISIAMNRIRTLRRIVLTGTPLQNNLKEYFCMVQFVKPNLLGTYKEYLNRFVNPITNGQYTDSTPHDIQIMRKRSHVLHKLLDGIVQRRDYAVLAPYLPPKHEYVIFVTLSQKQIALYDHYLNVIAPQQRTQISKGVSLFKDFQEFQRICTHPRVLLDKSVHDQMAKWKEEEDAETDGTEGSLKDFIDDDEDEVSTASESSKSSISSHNSDDGPRRGRSKPKASRTTRAVAAEKGIDVAATTSTLEVANTGSEWWREFISDQNLDDLLCSSKLALLFEILHQCEIIGDKVLIFSQSLYSLSIIEYFLSKIDDACQTGDSSAVGGYTGSWSLGLDYFRLDGSSSCDNRAAWCKTFNNPRNTRARLFLISTRAGGLGINLVAANRVIIFDVSWNPSHDIQSIYRVYRFGQIKPSYIYRFVTNGTMEMKVYERQVTKQAISKRVIDEQQIDRHYNQNDLAELYKFEPKPEHRPIPPVPKDILLGELVHGKAELIYKYHEHHTLLENKEEEELNEEERNAAWDEFENEKKMRQMPAHINNIPIHSIMLGLSNYLKREHPDWSAAEVQTAVPSLVQEMQEKMLLGDVVLYNSMIIELRSLQQQQQQLQQQRMQDYYRLQQQNQERMMLERHRQLMQTNATVSYLQRLYANATGNNMNPAALSALNALNNPLGNPQLNANQPQIIETVDIND